jgi:hypothetical protein
LNDRLGQEELAGFLRIADSAGKIQRANETLDRIVDPQIESDVDTGGDAIGAVFERYPRMVERHLK